MPDLPDVVLWSIPAFILLALLEAVSFRLHPDDDELGYEKKDTATSLTMGLGSLGWDVLWGIVPGIVYSAITLALPWHVPVGWQTILVCMVAWDFCYYWSHRSHHIVRILWASHVVHHSSQRFNLSTALRQPWTGFTGWLFYLPMIAAGVHPAVVAFCGSVNLVYQFWIHTERIDKMWRWFEFLFNTPSHHRVHHASQGGYLDRNFGGVLIVWDRLFGSFAPERERPIYGLTKNIGTYNPLRVAWHEYASIGRDVKNAGSFREVLGRIFMGPGWQPATAPSVIPADEPVKVAS